MEGPLEDIVCAMFDQLACVHHSDTITVLRDDSHVVGDQQHGLLQARVDLLDPVQDLVLHNNVEAGRRLVGNYHVRIQHHCHGDHCPLTHAAGELVWVVGQPAALQSNERKHFVDALALACHRPVDMRVDSLGNLLFHRIYRIKAVHGALRNQGDAPLCRLHDVERSIRGY